MGAGLFESDFFNLPPFALMKMRIKTIIVIFIITTVVAVFSMCKKDDYKNIDCGKINATYNTSIKLIIQNNCSSSSCHGSGSSNGDYTTYIGLKTIADNGKLNDRVLINKNMPSSSALSLDDRKKIKCWLNSGSQNN